MNMQVKHCQSLQRNYNQEIAHGFPGWSSHIRTCGRLWCRLRLIINQLKANYIRIDIGLRVMVNCLVRVGRVGEWAVLTSSEKQYECTVDLSFTTVRFLTIPFHDPCRVWTSTPDLWYITVANQASFLYLVHLYLFSGVHLFLLFLF
jgi:hypothetical protein